MVDRWDAGTALSSGAVDAQFWALVCEDEEWLDAQFAGIVGEPAEQRRRPRRSLALLVDRNRRTEPGPGDARGVDTGSVMADRGDLVSRQRSPPPPARSGESRIA
jgi:hypothetical protein